MCNINWEVVVNLLGIIVNGILAIWIVNTIQKKQNNERTIKDHFINEVKDFRVDCRQFLNATYNGTKFQREIIPTLKLLGIKSSQLLNTLNYCFNINPQHFNTYLIELNRILTDDPNFVSCKNENAEIKFHPNSLEKIIRFQSDHQPLFNDLILLINEAVYIRRLSS